MNAALAWNPIDRPAVVLLAVATVAYLIHHYLLRPAVLERALEERVPDEELQPASVFANRILGGALFLLVPGAAVLFALPRGLDFYGLAPGRAGVALLLALGAYMALVPLLAWNARNPAMHRAYPHARAHVWTTGRLAWNAGSWAVYLLGYEFLFRGFLTFGLAAVFGTWPGIAVMTALYVAVHLEQPWTECVGTVVMGPVFAIMALHTGTILGPWLLHCGIAITSDLLSIRANPAMTLR